MTLITRRRRPNGAGPYRKRAGRGTLSSLVIELEQLERRRQQVIARIRQETERLVSGEAPLPWRQDTGAATGVPGDRPKRFTMSAEARARISAAQKKRWAKVKEERE